MKPRVVDKATLPAGMSRKKQLELIVKQLQVRGDPDDKSKLTFAAVARAAGVSTALIHNHYPDVAESIRTAQGRSSRQQRDAKRQELTAERSTTRELRTEVEKLKQKVRALASFNETLTAEIQELQKRSPTGDVVVLSPRKRQNR